MISNDVRCGLENVKSVAAGEGGDEHGRPVHTHGTLLTPACSGEHSSRTCHEQSKELHPRGSLHSSETSVTTWKRLCWPGKKGNRQPPSCCSAMAWHAVINTVDHLALFSSRLHGSRFEEAGEISSTRAQQLTSVWSTLQVWVLDALPGEARAGYEKRQDHPQDLIRHLLRLPMPLSDRSYLQQSLADGGFSPSIQQWTATNLRPTNGNRR